MMIEIGDKIVWFCGILIALWSVLGIIQKISEMMKKPEKDQNSRITKLELELEALKKADEQFAGFFRNDKERIDNMAKGNAVMQKALLALLSHSIEGNNEAEMKEARKDLQNYLTERTVI